MPDLSVRIYPGQPVNIESIPDLSFPDFRRIVLSESEQGGRIAAFWGNPQGRTVRLFLILAYDGEGRLELFSTAVKDAFRSLTPQLPQAHWFEREIAEQWGVRPEGHPWLKPIRFHSSYRTESQLSSQKILPSVTDFFKVSGEEVHEVAVGPVHAGIIEPGHFRFQCHGEHVFHLEISLGYQHRGIERKLRSGVDNRTIHYMETLAGDTTIGHTLAYCQAIEGLSDCDVSPRAQTLRAVMLELERLANHTGDLGALANDVGFLPTASYCGRLRGDFLNMTALLCGNRFGRNMLVPGGVLFDLDENLTAELVRRLEKTFADTENAVQLLWDTASVMERLEGTGVVTRQAAQELGLVGPAARACGIERDARFDFPSGLYRFSQIPVSSCSSGDVFARTLVRWLEIQRSVVFLKSQLKNLPQGTLGSPSGLLMPDRLVVSLVEGWRGEICHTALTDKAGKIAQYKITDPSFHNWMGLAMAMRGEEISNFPLCNKSFSLSYCGHDL